MSEILGQTKIHLPMNQVLPGSQLPAFFSSSGGGGSASSASSSACGPRLVGPWKRASIIQEAPRVEQRQPPKKTCKFKTTETQNSFLSKVHVSCSGKTSSYGTHFFWNWKQTSFWWRNLFFRFCLLFLFLFLPRLVMVWGWVKHNSELDPCLTQNMAIESVL